MTLSSSTDATRTTLEKWFASACIRAIEDLKLGLSVICSDGSCEFVNAGLLTLVVEFENHHVQLCPSDANSENPAKSEFIVIPNPNGLKFQPIPQGVIQTFPRLDERQFLHGVLNVALLKGWESTT